MTKKSKVDCVITCVSALNFEYMRPFLVSLFRTSFEGDAVVLAGDSDTYTRTVLDNHSFTVVPFDCPVGKAGDFVVRKRFAPAIAYLEENLKKYRTVTWVDAGDLVFQGNPSEWFDEFGSKGLVCAKECWHVQDETHFNDPWMKASASAEDYEQIKDKDILCGGTIAGAAEDVLKMLRLISLATNGYDNINDQSYLTFQGHQLGARIPRMADGWTATCTSYNIPGQFECVIGLAPDDPRNTDELPKFDKKRGLVLTPDGSKPFVIFHQYNRDADWLRIIRSKYRFF